MALKHRLIISTVLRAIETATVRNRDLKTEIAKTIEEYLPLKSNMSKSDTLYEERRKDHISHFVLRMAYCRRFEQNCSKTARYMND